jgi:hypothetical protein
MYEWLVIYLNSQPWILVSDRLVFLSSQKFLQLFGLPIETIGIMEVSL